MSILIKTELSLFIYFKNIFLNTFSRINLLIILIFTIFYELNIIIINSKKQYYNATTCNKVV